MKKINLKKKGLAALLIAATTMTMTGCGSGGSGSGSGGANDTKDIKNLVYSSEKLEALDQMKGEVSSYCIAGDSIYVYTTEWLESEDGSQVPEEAAEDVATTETAAEGEEVNTETDAEAASEDADAEEAPEKEPRTQEEDAAEAEASEKAEAEAEAAEEDADAEDDDAADTENAEIEDAAADEEIIAEEDFSEEEYMSQMKQYFYSVKVDGSDFKEIPMETADTADQWLNYFCVAEDGTFYMLYNSYDQETGKSTYVVKVFDNAGKPQNEFDVSYLFDGQDGYFQNMKLDKDSNIVLMGDQSVYVVDSNGKSLYSVKSDNYIMGMALTNEGEVIVAQSTEDGVKVQALDSEKKAMGDTYDVAISGYGSSPLISGGEYSFYYSDGSSVFGYDIASGKSTELLNWISSNINTSYVGETQALADGRFITNYSDYSTDEGDRGLYVFTKVDPSEVADKIVISYAGLYVDDNIKSQAVKFNKSQDKYQMVVSDYSANEDPMTAMNADLLAGKVPDVIDLSGVSSEKYIAKGMLDDLYTYMDKDEDIKKEDFIDSILKVMETDGKLYHISPTFGVNTLIGRTEDVGGRESFNIQDLIDLEASKKEGTQAFYMRSNTSVLSLFCSSNYGDYIDWNTGKCNFDGEDFIKLLEYANEYPNDDDMDWTEDTESMPSQIRNGKVLFVDTYSMSMEEIELYNKMFEGDISFIGCPSSTDIGAAMNMGMEIGIYSKSKNKDGAWEFLKTFLTEEYISGNQNNYYSGFPLRKDCLENEIKKYSTTESYTDDFGNEISPMDSSWGYDDLEVQIGPLSDEEVQQIRDLIDSVDHMYVYNDEVMSIIMEESGAYFSGQKSSKEVADIIQNRISTYVNENR